MSTENDHRGAYPEDVELLTLFQKRLAAAKDARKAFDERCELIDKHVEPFNAKWSGDTAGDLRTPHVLHIIETMSANMVEPDPDFDLRPREPGDDAGVKATKGALSYSLERSNWPRKNTTFIRRGNRYGLSVAKVFWDYQELVTEEPVEQPHSNVLARMLGRTEEVMQENVRVLRDDAAVELVDKDGFYWQPRADCIEDCEWVIHEYYLPLEVLQRLEDEGTYRCVDKVGNAGKASDPASALNSNASEEDRQYQDEDGVKISELWDKVRFTLTTVANDSVIIGHDDFPFEHGELPFACYVPIPVDGRFEGISPVEPLIPLQLATWQTEADRMRAVAMALNPTLLVDKTLKKGGEFHIKPGGRIFVNDPGQIQQLNINSQQNLGFAEVEALLGYMQQVSGVSPFISGSDSSAYGINQNTATGVNQLAGAAGRRIGFHIQMLQDSIARIGRQMVQLMYEFMDGERVIRIVGRDGEQWVDFAPEDIPHLFDLTVKGSTESLNKQAERGQAMEFMQAMMGVHGMPTPDGRQIDATPAIMHLVESFGKDPDRFLPSATPETQAMQQAEVQQATGQAQQAQGDAQMADPQMQMMMQQMQGQQQAPGVNDIDGDGDDDLQRKAFESMNFKDLPPDAQAALLQARGLPSEGLMQQSQMDQAEKMAKIQQMSAQAAQRSGGLDNA